MSEGIWKGRQGTFTGIRSVSKDGITVQVIRNDYLLKFVGQRILAREKKERQTDLEPIPRKILSEH